MILTDEKYIKYGLTYFDLSESSFSILSTVIVDLSSDRLMITNEIGSSYSEDRA